MVWKDLLFGFLVAGAVAVLVPDAVFKAIFPQDLTPVLLVVVHAFLGPVLALLTIIGSMGNGPLAAVLWENGVLFAGVIAFLYADFVVIPSLRINTTYCWIVANQMRMVRDLVKILGARDEHSSTVVDFRRKFAPRLFLDARPIGKIFT